MNKRLKITIVVILVLLVQFIYQFRYSKEISCDVWMGKGMTLSEEYKTDEDLIDKCDNETFEVLNHEYAKDYRYVYYKLMPNAYNLTIILEGADSKSFELLKRCTGYAIDKNYVYLVGKIVANKDPKIFKVYDPNNSETFCH